MQFVNILNGGLNCSKANDKLYSQLHALIYLASQMDSKKVCPQKLLRTKNKGLLQLMSLH